MHTTLLDPISDMTREERRCAEDEDDQATPRASLVGVSTLPERSLPRDDTATDVSFGYVYPSTTDMPNSQTFPSHTPAEARQQFDAWAQADAFAMPRGGARQLPLPNSSRQAAVDMAIDQQKQVRSLGRRLSRNTKERLDQLRDGFSKHAPLPARMRRSSTPHHPEPVVHANGTIDPRYLVAPLSPSKRNARHGDNRARKFRSTFGLNLGERKDTPAPPTFGMASRPAPRPLAAGLWQQVPVSGGEGARAAAAAAHKSEVPIPEYAQFPEEDTWPGQEDLQTRRRRVCSLSSAADSGADLSKCSDDFCKDSVGDAEDMDIDEFVDAEPGLEPQGQDFVRTLPSEIALQIFEYLDAQQLCRAQRVSKAWKALGEEACIWRSAFLRKYGRQIYTDPAPIQVGGVGAGRYNRSKQEWQKMYKARLELEANWRKGPRDAGKAVYLSGHTDSVYCLQFDEEKIITGSRDRTIRVWDINTFQCMRVIGGPNVRPSLGPKVLRTVDYPHFHLATASVNGTAYGESIYHTPSEWHDASILCLQYDEEILVTGSSDSDLLIWDIHTYEPIQRLRKHTGGVLDVALDANHIISCSKDSRIIVWDRHTFEVKGELSGHRGPVNAVQLRGKYLVSASGDGIARLWDIDQLKLIKEFSAKERGLAAVEFSEDMKYVLAGGNDHITYKFEVETGKEVLQFTGHTQLVRSLWLDSANKRVVSGSYDLDLRVYDFETGQELWRAEEWTTSWMLAAKSDYRRIVATSQDGRILIVDFGLRKGGLTDGQPLDGVDLLRGIENTNAIVFRNPWRPNEEAH
ncbi:hypothetical protein B0A50_07011 [Salinomyces thailandicus]|uniref:F-box domain-containing protein n=1 Tax=Salinomyces thailandicus TaxID=706561 RepID=A0A4U0TPU0_9PEZI|nr:hypothetical protein B0A50_07011 [Salinomyces thailandica]